MSLDPTLKEKPQRLVLFTYPLPALALQVDLVLLGLLLCDLLLPGDAGLDANAAEHQPDAQDLHLAERVAEGNDREDHGEHLARNRDGNKEDRRERGESVD